MAKVWFITGTSSGFGRIWSEAALERGDQVAATARDVDTLADRVETYGDAVLPLPLDVTDQPAVDAAIAAAHTRFGRLDVVVNNAGFGIIGMIEEVTVEQARRQIETNLLGSLWVTQAALPIMREQRAGHIIQLSSVGGVVAFPRLGLYHATKWAIEGYSESLSAEVAGFGIKVTLVEPTGFDTPAYSKGAVYTEQLDAYAPLREQMASGGGMTLADPHNTTPVLLELVDADQPPLRVFFGATSLATVRDAYAKRLADWETWNELAVRAELGG
jgi:NAD(P)-dependent dehydrogenase (short-subunit alcohol dehydrogenase family)